MQLAYNPYMLPPLFAMLMAVVLSYRGLRYRTTPLGKTFLVLMLALAWWSFAVVLEYLSLELSAKVFWIKMSYFGITAIPVAWLVFTLQYTDKEKWLTRRNLAILAILPALTLIVVWTNGIHHLMWKDIWLDTSLSPPMDAVTHNAWFWVYAVYAYSLLLLGTLCIIYLFRKSQGIYRKQAGTLLLGAFVPWVGNFLFITGFNPFSVVDPTPIAFAITGIAFFWGLSRFQLLNIMPVAHDAILRSMADGVIVLDAQQRIVELNPAAQNIIGLKKSEVIGKPYTRVLPGYLSLLELKPDMTEVKAIIAMGEGQEQRYYRADITPINIQLRLSGHLVILHDDTERAKAEVESRERAILETELNERKQASEVIQRRLEFEETVAQISSRFVAISGIDKAITDSLADIGKFSKASRAFLFLITEDRTEMNNTHEWCANGVMSKLNNLKNLSCARFSWWMTRLTNKETILIKDVSRMPAEASEEKEIMTSLAIKSAVVLPIFVKEQLGGFIGVDNITETSVGSDNDLAILRVSSEIIGSALERKQTEEEIRQNYNIQDVLNSLLCLSLEDISLEGILRKTLELILSIPWLALESRGAIFLVEDDPETLVMKAQSKLAKPIQETCARLSFGKCLCGRAALMKEMQFADHVNEHHEIRYEGIIPHGHYCVPILFAGKTLGVINAYLREGRRSEQRELEFLAAVANTLAGIIVRKRAEEELANLNEELRSLNLQLESKVEERTSQLEESVAVAKASNQAKSEFLASMSHELRTPLNAIIGFSQVLHEQYFGNLNEKQAEYITDIVDSGKHLLSLINDILDLSKIEAGKMELEVSGVKIADLVQNSLVMIKEKALAHNLTLEIQIGEDVRSMEITGDERRLKQVMFNLLSNAAKFTPEGGAIKIEAKKNGKELFIGVSDTGIGMTPQEQKRLFEAFYQASGGIKDKTPGTGLGLAITKSIIEKHGGRIWMESEGRNKGSRFNFTLPI